MSICRTRVIGYIPLEGQRAKTRISRLLGMWHYCVDPELSCRCLLLEPMLCVLLPLAFRNLTQTSSILTIIIDVTRAKNNNDRLKILTAAAKEFNHNDVRKHDSDIKAGAIAFLCSILRSCSPYFIERAKEIQNCLTITLCLYRCSEERLCASFCTDGSALVLDLLELIEINYRLGKRGDAKSLVLAQNVVYKLCHARVPLAMVRGHDDLLSSLVSNINGVTGRFVMHLSMKMIASLSEHVQNKRVMFAFPGLMESIAVGSTHMCEAVREESARIIMNLALEARNKTHIIQGNNQFWLDAILTLSRGSSASKSYCLQTLGCVAASPENKVIMVQHKNCVVLDTLLQVATSRIVPSQDSINAARIICNLSCQATASEIGRHPGLLVTLSSLACREDKLAVVAAMAVKKIATHVRSKDSCHPDLLRTLVTMSYGRVTEVLKWTVKAFVEQAAFPRDRVKMIAHKGLLTALSVLSNDKNEFVRENADEVLNILAGKNCRCSIVCF